MQVEIQRLEKIHYTKRHRASNHSQILRVHGFSGKAVFFRSLIPGRLTTFQRMAPLPYVYEWNKLDPVSSRESGHKM